MMFFIISQCKIHTEKSNQKKFSFKIIFGILNLIFTFALPLEKGT